MKGYSSEDRVFGKGTGSINSGDQVNNGENHDYSMGMLRGYDAFDRSGGDCLSLCPLT